MQEELISCMHFFTNYERKNVIKSGFNLGKIVDLYNELDEVTVEIIDGDEFYNSFKVIDMK